MRLPRTACLLAVVLSLGAPALLRCQSVVPPGATYVGTAAEQHASTAARWPASPRGSRILRVAFAAPPAGLMTFWSEARWALEVWAATPGVPFEFEVVSAAEAHDVHFRWVDRFPTSQAGATHRRLDGGGLIRDVTVVLALSHANGVSMSRDFRRLVALHEVGHVLGLPHSEDPADVMHPGNRNLQISDRDIRSLEQLYTVPAD